MLTGIAVRRFAATLRRARTQRSKAGRGNPVLPPLGPFQLISEEDIDVIYRKVTGFAKIEEGRWVAVLDPRIRARTVIRPRLAKCAATLPPFAQTSAARSRRHVAPRCASGSAGSTRDGANNDWLALPNSASRSSVTGCAHHQNTRMSSAMKAAAPSLAQFLQGLPAEARKAGRGCRRSWSRPQQPPLARRPTTTGWPLSSISVSVGNSPSVVAGTVRLPAQ
jgi:hypothetical protein